MLRQMKLLLIARVVVSLTQSKALSIATNSTSRLNHLILISHLPCSAAMFFPQSPGDRKQQKNVSSGYRTHLIVRFFGDVPASHLADDNLNLFPPVNLNQLGWVLNHFE
jgi:hypothetical protein